MELWSDLYVIGVTKIYVLESVHELVEVCIEFCLMRVVLLAVVVVEGVFNQFNAI